MKKKTFELFDLFVCLSGTTCEVSCACRTPEDFEG